MVRHAEKQGFVKTPDPSLSPIGLNRAKSLAIWADLFEVKHIFTSQYLRTRETAEPSSQMLGIPLNTIHASNLRELVAKVEKVEQGGVLIVGHSNTVSPIISSLGGGEIDSIEEDDYANLYVLKKLSNGTRKLYQLKY